MALVLEIEYLSGVSFASMGSDSAEPDWPPQPDRIFSALVAAWAAHGEKENERLALEWLEQQPAPRLFASGAESRQGGITFVPPNDPRSDRQKHAREVLPTLRSRQMRRFPAARPYDPIVRLAWPGTAPDEEVMEALQQLARDTAYVGHSMSLTRCQFMIDSSAPHGTEAQLPKRWVYRGRFAELCAAFTAGRRPLAGAPVAAEHTKKQTRKNAFDKRWLILQHVGGEMPDIRASALIAKTIRDALLSGYQRTGMANAIPEVVSGHSAQGEPSRSTHIAIVPLPFVGHRFADGHIMGFALIPPNGSEIFDDENFRRALRAVAPIHEERRQRVLTISTKRGTGSEGAFRIELSPTFEAPADRHSLAPIAYVGRARCFGSITPIVLDRHLKGKDSARQGEIADHIARACRNIDLPEPETIRIDKHSAIEGAQSARPSGRSPSWMGWRLPASLVSRQLVHAVIRFSEPVDGPVILGAGRFAGLGLCQPIGKERG